MAGATVAEARDRGYDGTTIAAGSATEPQEG